MWGVWDTPKTVLKTGLFFHPHWDGWGPLWGYNFVENFSQPYLSPPSVYAYMAFLTMCQEKLVTGWFWRSKIIRIKCRFLTINVEHILKGGSNTGQTDVEEFLDIDIIKGCVRIMCCKYNDAWSLILIGKKTIKIPWYQCVEEF